jgi:hypothetical protein
MVVLKIPIAALLWLVWWSVRARPELEGGEDDGGGPPKPHAPRDPLPRLPRRGPHGEPPVPAPPRTRRPVRAASRSTR